MRLAAICAALVAATPVAADTSAFECYGIETATTLPIIEGKDGYFFRTLADLRMQHPMSDFVVDQLAELSAVLEENGTTLVYIPIPTKSQTMPDMLPERAGLYGFDIDVATAVYKDIVDRLEARDVVVVDMQTALMNAPKDQPPFFRADFHWTSDGARQGAAAIAARIRATPAYADLELAQYETEELPAELAFSGMRLHLQSQCKQSLPEVVTKAYRTSRLEAEEDIGGGLDIFAGGGEGPQIALAGTSFSDSPINNFAGFISQESGLEVTNYSITGGNQFGSIMSYVTSDDFLEARPRYLLWENPIYNNLAQFGSRPMQELIAAAGQACTLALTTSAPSPETRIADLSGLTLNRGDVLEVHAGGEGSRLAQFTFEGASGRNRSASISRDDRLRATGRYYQPLDMVWLPDLTSVSVTFDRPVPETATLTICKTSRKDDT